MNKIKFSHILFSLVLIAALALAAIPLAPAHALSTSTANTVMTASQVNAEVLTSNNGVVCRGVVIWRNGHRTVIRRCHKVTNTAS